MKYLSRMDASYVAGDHSFSRVLEVMIFALILVYFYTKCNSQVFSCLSVAIEFALNYRNVVQLLMTWLPI